MAYSLVSNTAASGTDSSVTTTAINTTGASLLVLGIAVDGAATPTISDSKGNTWTALTAQSLTVKTQLYYATNPTVGTGHTFSNTGASNFCSIFVASFSGAATTSPFDQQNGATATGVSTISTGSVTPTNNNELVITQLGFNSAGLPTSIDNGFTKTNDVEFGAANNYGGSMAYKIQTTATAVNPSWTRTGTLAQTAVIATFNVAITTIRNSNVLLMGVG